MNLPSRRLSGAAMIRWAGLAAALSLPSAFGQTVVSLGNAAAFGVLGSDSITTIGTTLVNGDLGLVSGTAITGFAGYGSGGLGVVNGSIEVENGLTTQAAADLSTAYTALKAEAATVSGVTSLTNQTLTPGVYNSSATLSVTGTVTLDGQGQSNSVFIFQIGTALTTTMGSQIVLTNGASAQNVFWEVGTSATLGGATLLQGDVLAGTSIGAGALSVIDGSLFAMDGAVTLSSDTISAVPEPAQTCLIVGAAALAAAAAKRRFHQLRPVLARIS